ncbi:MAG: DNA-binding transcriptional LysR family regulator [Psychromonas sp.]
MQLLSLGVGYLPVHRIQQELQMDQLVALTVEKPENRNHDLCIAWCKDNKGNALAWFVEKIQALTSNVFLTN